MTAEHRTRVVDALRPLAEWIARRVAEHLPQLIKGGYDDVAALSGLKLLRQLGPAAEEALPVLWDPLRVPYHVVRWELARSIIAISPDQTGVFMRARGCSRKTTRRSRSGTHHPWGSWGRGRQGRATESSGSSGRPRIGLLKPYAAWALGEIDPETPEVQSALAEVRANWPVPMRGVEELASSRP